MMPYPIRAASVSGPFHGHPAGVGGQRAATPTSILFSSKAKEPGAQAWLELSQGWKPPLRTELPGNGGPHTSKAGPTHEAKQAGSPSGHWQQWWDMPTQGLNSQDEGVLTAGEGLPLSCELGSWEISELRC